MRARRRGGRDGDRCGLGRTGGSAGPQLALERCRRHLATLWLVAAAAFFLTLLAYTTFGDPRGGGRGGDATVSPGELWSWLLAALVPSLSLLMGVFVGHAGQASVGDGVDRFLFRLSFGLSAVYLLALGVSFTDVLLLDNGPRATLRVSNLWLGPLQGLVTASLGAFFVHVHGGGDARARAVGGR